MPLSMPGSKYRRTAPSGIRTVPFSGYRQRVVIEAISEERDSAGEPVASWGTLDTVWAAVEPLQGREFFEASAVRAELSVRVRMRYRTDITPKMRLRFGSRILAIDHIIDVDGLNRELLIYCKELI